MMPAQPPLPTASYLWFQSDAGSQSSTLMSESLVGVRVASTRQKAGRSLYGLVAGPLPARPLGFSGRVKAPAATVCAAVIVASGNFSEARESHVAANPVALAIAKTR